MLTTKTFCIQFQSNLILVMFTQCLLSFSLLLLSRVWNGRQVGISCTLFKHIKGLICSLKLRQQTLKKWGALEQGEIQGET